MPNLTETTPGARLAAILERCRDDPVRFSEVVLGDDVTIPGFDGRSMWWRQRQVARAITHHRRVLVPAANGVGKSFLAARLVLWWLYTRKNALVVTTSVSQTQLAGVLWREIARAHGASAIPLGGKLTCGLKTSPQVLELSPSARAIGLSTTTTERLSGIHAEQLMVLADESSGIPEEIWAALESLNPLRLVAIGNPNRPSGRFYEMVKAALDGDEQSCVVPISAIESPHAHLERSPIGMSDRPFIEDYAHTHGVDSIAYQIHILGLFPDVSSDVLIPRAWLDRAVAAGRERRVQAGSFCLATDGIRRMGVDLGEGSGRDKSVIAIGDSAGLIHLEASSTMGLPETAARVAKLALEWGVSERNITFDALGCGRDFRAHLAHHGLRAVAYKGSDSGGRSFVNLRSAAAWALRRRLSPDQPGPDGKPQRPYALCPSPHLPALIDELAGLSYDLVGGKTRLERKEDVIARLGHSPDHADALCQLHYR